MTSSSLDVALEPAQPKEVVRAVALLLDTDQPQPDPWWRAGLDEALADA